MKSFVKNSQMLKPPMITGFSRDFSFNSLKFWGNNCEKVECTKSIEPVQKYIVQKSCCPSIFETWKPKIPDLNCSPSIKENMASQYKYRVCKSGMKSVKQDGCEVEVRAKECRKINHPKWVNFCPPKQAFKPEDPLPLLKQALLQCKGKKGNGKPSKKRCEPEIPESDWDTDGSL